MEKIVTPYIIWNLKTVTLTTRGKFCVKPYFVFRPDQLPKHGQILGQKTISVPTQTICPDLKQLSNFVPVTVF